MLDRNLWWNWKRLVDHQLANDKESGKYEREYIVLRITEDYALVDMILSQDPEFIKLHQAKVDRIKGKYEFLEKD